MSRFFVVSWPSRHPPAAEHVLCPCAAATLTIDIDQLGEPELEKQAM
ncbi:MAG: hypothetical protein R3C56_13710 [Pirellulaceae bacterium]